MLHVFVETNWVVAYASPAHHKVPAAISLLQRARQGEIHLHLPAPCVAEARHPIVTKCQPRREADAIRQFLLWGMSAGLISEDAERTTRTVLDQFEAQTKPELSGLHRLIQGEDLQRSLISQSLQHGAQDGKQKATSG